MSARFIVADVFDGLATLEDGSVHSVITSPPCVKNTTRRNGAATSVTRCGRTVASWSGGRLSSRRTSDV